MGKYTGNTDNKFLRLTDDTIGVYNAWDSYNTARLVAPLLAEITHNKQLAHYEAHVEPLQTAVVNMQARGMLLGREAKALYRRKLRRELDEVDEHLGRWHYESTGVSGFSPNSPKQVAAHLFGPREAGGLGLLPGKTTGTGAYSTDQEALTAILRKLRKKDEHAREFLHALFHRSRLQTIDERYLDFDVSPDGRVRSQVKMAKAKTMRLAYQSPPLQQFVPEIRHIFVARPGHVFLSRDYSQLEAKLVAYMSCDQPSINVFESGGDVHTANAIDLFNTDVISKPMRDYAKSYLYKIIYGGAGSEKERTSCPCVQWGCAGKQPGVVELKRADKLAMERRWFALHPAVQVFQRELIDKVKRTHYYEHPLGGRRYFTAPMSAQLEREIMNFPFQYGSAVLMARAQISLDKQDAPIVLQMHDEFLLEIPERQVQHWDILTKVIMEKPVEEFGGVSFSTDLAVGKNWGPYDATNNPLGMRDEK